MNNELRYFLNFLFNTLLPLNYFFSDLVMLKIVNERQSRIKHLIKTDGYL